MSKFTSFAVVGAGHIGKPIIDALLANNAGTVYVLSRSADKAIPGTKTVVVDYDNPESIKKAFTGVQVVVSTVGSGALSSQTALLDAAKAAGVQLFVLSEFGMPTEGYTEGFLLVKNKTANHAKSIGLPTVRVYNGYFIEYVKFITAYDFNGKVNVVGNDEALGSVTSIADIAGFVGYVLTHLPPSELEDKVFRIQGEKLSMKDIAKILGTTTQSADAIPGPAGANVTILQSRFAAGALSTGWNEALKKEGEGDDAAGSGNRFWPDHKWLTVAEVLNK